MIKKITFRKSRQKGKVMMVLLLLLSLVAVSNMKSAMADGEEYDPRYYPKANVYQIHKKESGYDYSDSSRLSDTELLPFGKKYAGDFYLSGDKVKEKTLQGEKGFATNGKIVFNYAYDGSLSDKGKKEWQFYEDDQKKVNGFSLSRKIEKGTVIIDKSYDGVTWSNEDYYTNFFDRHKEGMQGLYETKEEDVKHGTYYRVTVAYTVCQLMDSLKFDPTGLFDDYDFEECIEVYTFYVGADQSTLHICDIFTGTDITNPSISVKNGFAVMSDSPLSKIYVKEPNGSEHSVANYTVFSKQGDYSIRLESAFGDKHN